MVSFIIVEDSKKEQDEIKKIINKVTFKTEINFEIKVFDKYDANLKKVIEDTSEVKIYILDIELGDKVSGIQIAKKIRNYDLEDEIIFITNHDHMFEEVYRSVYKVYDFIEKFNNFEERLTKSLENLIKREYDNRIFRYNARNLELDLYIKNILYVYRDSCDRKLVIKTLNNTYTINMSIKDIKEKLGSKFKQISRSCLVNEDYIESYNYAFGYVVLSNGEKVEYLAKNYRDNEKVK